MRFLAIVAVCVLSWPLSGLAQNGGTFKGLVVGLTKDQGTPTGTITVTNGAGKLQKYRVDEFTTWQFVQGKTTTATSFLGARLGQQVIVTAQAGTNPVSAATVQIILPAAVLPPGVRVPKANANQVHGVVQSVNGDTLILAVGHGNPPPVSAGTVTKMNRDPKNNFGSITVNVTIGANAGSTQTYTVNAFTSFQKMFVTGAQPSDFLADITGQQVVIVNRWGDNTVASKVQIIQNGTDVYTVIYQDQHQPYSVQSYQYTVNTKFDYIRDGKSTPANINALQAHEWVNLDLAAGSTSVATAIHVLQPHAVTGQVLAITPNSISVKVHHFGNNEMPAHDTVANVGLVNTTSYFVKAGNTTSQVTIASVQVGQKVTVLPDAVRPHPADKVTIYTTPSKKITVKGTINSIANGSLIVQTSSGLQSFALTNNTKIVLVQGKNKTAGNAGNLTSGRQVSVQAMTGPPPVAIEVDVTVPKTKS